MTEQKAKKEWEKPEINLLSSANDVNGGHRSNFFHEVHNGKHTEMKTHLGDPAFGPTSFYNNNAHS